MDLSANTIRARLRQANRWTIAAAVLLGVLFVGLSVRANDEYRWSDWGFGDAQTMLSLKQWEEGGWFKNYLLFKPQGYAKVIDLLDEPELRHHAHGTCPGSSPRIGPRLWYTHYPAGYLIPYAALFRAGFDSMFAGRMLSIFFSVTALLLMYVLFEKITSSPIALISLLFYGLSPSFLGYADSLANQPIDDLLRFGFMLAVVLSTRSEKELARKRWSVTAWVLEFCLSLTSFDSVFFLYVWLIGWDLLDAKGFRWRRYLLFACAPVTAHGLQFLQNVWYLGLREAAIDIKDAFLLKHGTDTGYNLGEGRFATIALSLLIIFGNIYDPPWQIVFLLVLYGIFAVLYRRGNKEFASLQLLLVLFLAGLSFVLVLPHAARMPYEARQMMPLNALLAGSLTWSLSRMFQRALGGKGQSEEGRAAQGLWATVLYLLAGISVVMMLWFTFVFQNREPVYELGPRKAEMQFAQQLPALETRYESVYFDIGGFSLFWDPKYVPGYPQILPLTEYYADSRPILCFQEPEKIAEDIAVMVRKSSEPFSPVVIAADQEVLRKTLDALGKKGVLKGRPTTFPQSMGRYAMDLSDFIRWRSDEGDPHSRKP